MATKLVKNTLYIILLIHFRTVSRDRMFVFFNHLADGNVERELLSEHQIMEHV